MLACNTGLRPGEQRLLQFADTNLEHAFFAHPEQTRDRIPCEKFSTPLYSASTSSLRSHFGPAEKEAPGFGFRIQRPDGKPWGDIGASFDDLVVAAGLQKERAPQRLTPHSLRHTYASWLAIAGVSLRRIQELLGHKSITTTERYSHLGHNGQHPYYFELARCCLNGFVPRFVTSPSPDALANPRKLLTECGGGGATRTPDLGIMSLSPPDFEALQRLLNEFDFEENTLP
jgi:hypothetical protein